ncbi:MAG: class I SAM-dependent methyltransferase [Chloroflexi bacterium]|nr:MAG: class I SAM-dependent methyltransferase [Chloroflexota bacterium]
MSQVPVGDHFERVATAFSQKALVYDEFGRDHENLTRMREKVYAHICRLVPPGGHLLELNAGTGLDAVALVQRGYRVHATDLSPGMVAQIRNKIVRYDLGDRLTVQQCSFTALDEVNGRFHAVYSNFGGLNCIDDLSLVTRHLPRLLFPGGIVTWVVMPHICPWELAHFWRGVRSALRRLRPGGVLANVEGVRFRTYYFSVNEVRRAFGPQFRQVALEGLSVVTPTADNKHFAQRYPRLYRQLVRLDDWLCQKRPFSGWGDFFILSMRYEG